MNTNPPTSTSVIHTVRAEPIPHIQLTSLSVKELGLGRKICNSSLVSCPVWYGTIVMKMCEHFPGGADNQLFGAALAEIASQICNKGLNFRVQLFSRSKCCIEYRLHCMCTCSREVEEVLFLTIYRRNRHHPPSNKSL